MSNFFAANPARRWHLLAALLILVSAGLRLAYLAFDCPLDLAPDEAHYWDWSRNLDWSYYSKGPLVALLVRASTALAGPWSIRLTGSEMLAVRLPAVACGGLLLASLYVLTLQVLGRPRLGVGVVALALTLPPVTAGSLLMTIDAPYTCCWGWALVLGHRAVFRGSAWAWPAAGLAVGLGVLAKYTMLLWLPAFTLFLLTSPGRRRLLLRPGFWVMTGTAAACCLPILVWGARHDWVSFRHVLGQAVGAGPAAPRWLGPLEYVGVQCGLLVGFWFAAWLAAMISSRPWREPDEGKRFLWWMSATVFLTFLTFSVRTVIEPNWPVAAFISGLVLAVRWLAERWEQGRPAYRRLIMVGATAAGVVGLAVNVLMLHAEWFHPVLASVAGPPTAGRALPLRRIDPTCRLRGWRFLAVEVDRVRAALRREGVEPVLVGGGWTLPGEIGFYCQGHPPVYSLGLALGDRHSQYDLWRPNPVSDPDRFAGAVMVFVGEVSPGVRAAFERVEAPRVVTYQEGGRPLARWTVTVCRGFRGFQKVLSSDERQRF